jgi:DNA-binding transcriptional ArsR family regulator
MRNMVVTHSKPRPVGDPFDAVADPTRRAILGRLRAGELTVGALIDGLREEGIASSRPAISRHLRVLRTARLVTERRGQGDARERHYRITPAPLQEVAAWALTYQQFWTGRLDILKRRLEAGAPERSA